MNALAGILFLALAAVACDGREVSAPPAAGSAIVIAHRGASAVAPEHTIAAYDSALVQGADYLELDVQRSKDGVIVVIHDQTLNRTARGSESNCAGPVADKTIAQLKTCDVGSWFNLVHPLAPRPEFIGLRIPTLEEVLSRYGSTGRFYIETKDPETYPGIERGIIDLLKKYGIVAGSPPKPRVFIQSFSAASLLAVHAIDSAMPVVQLLDAITPAGVVAQLDQVRSYATGIGPIKSDVTAAIVEAAHGKCILVHPYTVNDDDEMLSLLAMGVDGMFTNRPDRLREMINRTPVRTVGVTGCIAVTH